VKRTSFNAPSIDIRSGAGTIAIPEGVDPQIAYEDAYARLVERAPQDPDAFALAVLRDQNDEPVELSPLHRLMTKFVTYCWSQDPPISAAILAPWRHGKTVLGPIRFPIFYLGKNPNTRIRLVCGDDREAVLRVAAIQRFVTSKEYGAVFPNIRPSRSAEWTKHSFFIDRPALGPDPSVSAAGVFSAEAGGGNDIIALDDVVTHKNSVINPAVRPKVYDALTSVWLRRVDPQTKILLVGTRWHYDDAYGRLMREGFAAGWLWLIVRVSQDFKSLDWEVAG